MSTERKEFHRLTVEVRAFFPPLICRGWDRNTICAKPHSFLLRRVASHSLRSTSQKMKCSICFLLVFAGGRGNDQACRATSHFAASLTFISNLSDRGKPREMVILCLELLPRQVLPCSLESDLHGIAGDQETAAGSRKCPLPLTPVSQFRTWPAS